MRVSYQLVLAAQRMVGVVLSSGEGDWLQSNTSPPSMPRCTFAMDPDAALLTNLLDLEKRTADVDRAAQHSPAHKGRKNRPLHTAAAAAAASNEQRARRQIQEQKQKD
eukprot:6087046-Amphidinium_carterae.1